MRTLLAVILVMALAVPANAGVPSGVTVFDQLWQWISQLSQVVWQVQDLYENLRGQVFDRVLTYIENARAGEFLQRLRALLDQLGQLSGAFGWAYQGALRDLESLIGIGQSRPYNEPWFVENNPGTKKTVERIAESAITTASAVARSQQAAQVSAQIGRQVSTGSDVAASTAQTYGTAQQLAGRATSIPSSRTGIQMLIAGQSAMMRAQADALGSIASRLNALSQQQAATSQQLDAMNQSLKQVADNQQKELEQQEKDKQAILNMTSDAASKSYDAALTYMRDGIVGKGGSAGAGLFTGIRRKK